MLSVSVFLLDCLHSDVTSTGLVVARNYTRSPPDALPMNVRQLGRPFSATFTLTNNGPLDDSLWPVPSVRAVSHSM